MSRKHDLRQVEAIIREFDMDIETGYEFSDYLHQRKDEGYRGTANARGDSTMDELRALAREFLGLGEE